MKNPFFINKGPFKIDNLLKKLELKSIKDFKNTEGDKGGFQDNFKVYQREGLTCKRFSCRGKIIKKRIGNRSIFANG